MNASFVPGNWLAICILELGTSKLRESAEAGDVGVKRSIHGDKVGHQVLNLTYISMI